MKLVVTLCQKRKKKNEIMPRDSSSFRSQSGSVEKQTENNQLKIRSGNRTTRNRSTG